uniref:HUN domain-containing protein n=1 Tax=Rhabditophanes sp. KR3021 TaxID=114890 RepID=A0AC35UGC8_9BILA
MDYTFERIASTDKRIEDSCSIDILLSFSTSSNYIDIDFEKVLKKNGFKSESEDPKIDSVRRRLKKSLKTSGIKCSNMIRHFSKADLIKRNHKYDDEDDFINDEEGHDELMPFNCETTHKGHYVNEGRVELVKVFEIEDSIEPANGHRKRAMPLDDHLLIKKPCKDVKKMNGRSSIGMTSEEKSNFGNTKGEKTSNKLSKKEQAAATDNQPKPTKVRESTSSKRKSFQKSEVLLSFPQSHTKELSPPIKCEFQPIKFLGMRKKPKQ